MVSKPEYFVHLLFYLTFEQQWKKKKTTEKENWPNQVNLFIVNKINEIMRLVK